MNKKVKGKMSLSKETLGNLNDASLKDVAGGHTHGTNVCTECTVCGSCNPSCPIETGICYNTCPPICP